MSHLLIHQPFSFHREPATSTGYASRVWKQVFSSRVKTCRAPHIAERTSGWNRLPSELIDEILQHLSDDIPALKACSLTCKIMHNSARPIIGSWLYLSPARKKKKNGRSMRSLLKRSKRGFDGLERLGDLDRRGLLPHTRHLVLKMDELALVPQSLQPYIPYFLHINNLKTLVINGLDVTVFAPAFPTYLGMFTRSLRSLDIRHIWDSDRQLLWFISQFPLLEDLSIQYCYAAYFFLGPSPPLIRTSPPFRGHLNLSLFMDSLSLCEALAQFPGGLHFTSVELKGCGKPAVIIRACQTSLRSISYTWTTAVRKYRLHLFWIGLFHNFQLQVAPWTSRIFLRSRSSNSRPTP